MGVLPELPPSRLRDYVVSVFCVRLLMAPGIERADSGVRKCDRLARESNHDESHVVVLVGCVLPNGAQDVIANGTY